MKLHEDIPNSYWVMAHTRMFAKKNSKARGITRKLRKGEQLFLFVNVVLTQYIYIYIPIKLHEGVFQSVFELWRIQECLQKLSKGHSSESKKGEQSFQSGTRRSDLIHIPIKLHEGIPNRY